MKIESWPEEATTSREYSATGEAFHAKSQRLKVTQRPTKTRSRRQFVLIPSLPLRVLTLRCQQSCQNGERRDPIKDEIVSAARQYRFESVSPLRGSEQIYARSLGLADSPWA